MKHLKRQLHKLVQEMIAMKSAHVVAGLYLNGLLEDSKMVPVFGVLFVDVVSI